MGVSLQTHRLRIGTFAPKLSNAKIKCSPNETFKGNFKTPLFLLLMLNMLLVILVLYNELLPTVFLLCPLRTTCTTWSPPGRTSSTLPSSSSTTLPTADSTPPQLVVSLSYRGARLRQQPTYPCSTWLSSEDRNLYAKITNGNRAQRGHGIKLLHWNKGPSFLQNKHHEIETIIGGHTPHVLGLSEANLKADHNLSLVQHPDYELHTCPTLANPSLGVSRIVVYTHNSLVVKRRHDLEDDKISAIWLEAGLPRQKKIVICQAYREWQYLGQDDNISGTPASQLVRWLIFLEKWELALQEGKEVIVMMDANLDFLKWTRDDLPATDSTTRLKPLIDQLFSRIFPHGVAQLVHVPTRAWPGQPDSGLDHIYSNKVEKLSEVYTEFAGGSDHKVIKVTRYAKSLKKSIRYVRKRVYKNFKDDEFCQAVHQLSWWNLYICENPSEAAQLLTSKLAGILDTMAPVKTIQVRTKYAAWLSEDTKKLIKVRNEAHSTAMRSGCQDDWRAYKNMRNSATTRMQSEKRVWEKHKLDHSEQNPSTLWRNVKGWLNWGNSGPPTQLFHEGRVINSPAGIAGTMNTFFTSKVSTLRSNIPPSNSDPLSKLRENFQQRDCSMSFKAVEPKEVLQAIMKLKNSKSTGIDDIDTRIIKLVAKDILPALTHVINLSISHSEFPSIWKQSKVVPLLKKGDTLSPKNYRPVALLPIFSKILERVIFNQLVKYLDENNLVNPNHHGSRQGHSTATALIQMYDQWVEEIEDGCLVGVMMIDLSAAFDMVDHPLLLEKLKLFGLEDRALSWIRSYLADRTQSVYVDGCLSPPLDIVCGVPQGSILGPLMYIIFTNDIPDLVHPHTVDYKDPKPYCKECGSTVCYVDDGTFSFGHADPEEVTNTLTTQYDNIAEYMIANKLVINDDKTQLVVMSSKANIGRRTEVSLTAGQHIIEQASSAKLLGGIVSQDLKWKKHLLTSDQSVIRQVTSRVNSLSLISPRATFRTRLMVANGIVVSKICYLIQLWGGCEDYLLHPLQVLMNKAARIVTGCNRFTSTRRLLTKCNWLSIKQLILFQTVTMTHKMMLSKSPYSMYKKFSMMFPYDTRQARGGCIRYTEEFHSKKSLSHDSFRYRAAKDYNLIPVQIRNCRSMATFKTKLKKWVVSNIPVD